MGFGSRIEGTFISDAPVQQLLNGNVISEACKTVMENNLKETRDQISNLTSNAELHYKLISNIPVILIEGLRRENPSGIARVKDITNTVTKAVMAQGTII